MSSIQLESIAQIMAHHQSAMPRKRALEWKRLRLAMQDAQNNAELAVAVSDAISAIKAPFIVASLKALLEELNNA